MSWPDSGWLKHLKETGPGFFLLAAGGVGAVAIVWRFFPGTFSPPFPTARAWVEAVAIALFAIGALLLVWRASAVVLMLRPMLRRRALDSRYKKLSERQCEILISAYRAGSRDFDFPTKLIQNRYFEELQDWGFIEPAYAGIYIQIPEDMPYRITREAWHVIRNKIP